MDQRKLFDDDQDRARFLKWLGEAVEEYGVRLPGSFLAMGTGSGVCLQLKRLRDRRTKDSSLAAHIERIEAAIERVKDSHETHEISIIKG